jgi:hypothetical protein
VRRKQFEEIITDISSMADTASLMRQEFEHRAPRRRFGVNDCFSNLEQQRWLDQQKAKNDRPRHSGTINFASGLPTNENLLGGNLQIGKVALGARSDPQCDSSFQWLELQIVDDEAGLLGSVHV